MRVEPTKRFLKEYKKCPVYIQTDISRFLDEMEGVDNLLSINNVKKLKGHKNYFRYKSGSWRIGLELDNGIVIVCIIITVQPRGDIYKNFP